LIATEAFDCLFAADHRPPVGMALIASGEQSFGQLAAGNILTALNFFKHNLLLFAQLVGVEGGVLNRIGHDGETGIQVSARQGNVVDRMIKRGKGVDIAPRAFDLLGDFPDATCHRALKEHVFVHMRDASLGIPLVDAPDLYPHIQGDHRSAVIFLQKHG
jgi:hypothetical protein